MLLHDSFFFSSNQSINKTHYTSIIMAHSPLFHSTLTLIISIFGACSNFICIIYLCFIISQHKQRKLKNHKTEQQKSFHILSNNKYRFFVILTSSDFLLCLSSIISCLDEKYYSQSLIALYHLCSFHILMWKFTLHFTPLLTIFILLRYHYISNKKFPSKYFHATTLNQLFCTDLCILIAFVIAFAWSVDGLWLWGETNIKNFVTPPIIHNEQNQTNEVFSTSSMNTVKKYSENKFSKIICYLQTNDNLDFTARLLYFIQADFLLLFSLHFIGFLLEILLHIRLCCCLISRKITPSFLREQQLSIYILYIFICLTLTSLPFYFYRMIEILFDSQISSYNHDIINSRILAQIILFGISFKPILYFILLIPSEILFKFKCYTSIQIDHTNDNLLDNQLNSKQKNIKRLKHDRYSLRLSLFHPKFQINIRRLSNPIILNNNHHLIDINHSRDILDTTDL